MNALLEYFTALLAYINLCAKEMLWLFLADLYSSFNVLLAM